MKSESTSREHFINEMHSLVEVLDQIEKHTPYQAVEPIWIDDLRAIRRKAVDCIRKNIKSQ